MITPAARPPSRSKGDSGSSAGFTLIELLVVLTMIGLLLSLAPSLVSAARPGTEVKTEARALADTLRAAREAAIARNGEAQVVLDLGRRDYEAADGRVRFLPRDLAIVFKGPADHVDGQHAAIRFFADGSSSGGAVTLASGGTTRRVSANWLTGGVSIDE